MKSGKRKIIFKTNQIHNLKTVFNRVFDTETLNELIINLPATKNLEEFSSENSNFGILPIDLILPMLKERKQLPTSLESWVFEQIINTGQSIHPKIVELIEAYVTACVIPHTQISLLLTNIANGEDVDLNTITCTPFPEKLILEHFDKLTAAGQILLIYYVVLYQDIGQKVIFIMSV